MRSSIRPYSSLESVERSRKRSSFIRARGMRKKLKSAVSLLIDIIEIRVGCHENPPQKYKKLIISKL